MVLAVVSTLILGSIAFGVGAAWNNTFQQLVREKRFPMWCYALLSTVGGVGVAIGIAYLARYTGISHRLNGLGDAVREDASSVAARSLAGRRPAVE